MAIHDDDVAAVKAATDFVAVVTGYLQLRKVGRRWVGLCPFHGEKTPSFSVNGEQGLFYCFGCQRSGDAITFVQDVEQVDFAGAVEHLARRAGITLRYTASGEGERRQRRSRLTEALAEAVEWYHQRLLSAPDAAPARRYLRSRGFDGEQVRRFRLGWAPDAWDDAVRALGLERERAVQTGLGLVNRAGRLQDFFRARVLFPIFDAQGDPVGFGGRQLEGGNGPKYLNPGSNPVYDKSRVLYGLNWAKADIVNAGEVIVCEGYTDVIGFHGVGLGRAVATCGTALTEDHVKLLTRFAKRVVLAFDADAAGSAAAERFLTWEQHYGIDVTVADLPKGVDPADLARRDPDELRRAVAEALPFVAFRLERVFAAANLATAEGRARAARAAAALVAEHPDQLVREQYLLDIATRCRVEVGPLRSVGTPPPAPAKASSPSGGRAGERSPVGRALPTGGRWIEPVHPGSACERDALRLAVERPELVGEWFDPALFADDVNRRAVEALADAASLDGALDAAPDDVADLLRRLAAEQTDASPEEAFLRLAREASARALRMLRQAIASGPTDPVTAADVRRLGLWHDQLGDYERQEDERLRAGIELLTWLLDRGEGKG